MTFDRGFQPRSTFQTAIVAHGITKFFGARNVIDSLDLTVVTGETIAIIGQSGCGKSTLLRILQGIETFGKGSLSIDGKPQTGVVSSARTVFQDGRLLPWRTVEGNLRIANPSATAEQIDDVLAQVNLMGHRGAWPYSLSGGQKQRIALARALLASPKILFLDEPLASLDALTRLTMQGLLRGLLSDGSHTVVLVTHDIDEALFLADRVLLMVDGKIGTEWSVDFPHPRDREHSDFVRLRSTIRRRIFCELKEFTEEGQFVPPTS